MSSRHLSYSDPNYPVELFAFHSSSIDLIPSHSQRHKEMELVLVESGALSLQIDDQNLLVRANQGIFINQNVPHTICNDREQPFTVSSLRFLPDLIFRQPSGRIADQYLTPVVNSPRLHYVLLDKENRETSDMLFLLKQIIPAYQSRTLGHELDVIAMLCRFWKYLLQLCSGDGEQPDVHLSQYDIQRVTSALQYIEEHYAEPLTLDDIASSIHTSNSECCRCFRRVMGLSPFEYLLKFRIFQVASLLRTKEAATRTISDLAASAGFNSPSYFNKKFKQYLHCTPKEYRSNYLKTL